MTGEEMERAIEFLLKSQANLEAQIAETNRIVQLQAETQSEFIQIVTQAMANLADAQTRTERTVGETNARLDRLASLVERHIEDEHAHS